ncbi:DUF6966 domain-containing protein [Gallaecimonas mangrovi]|uniref:DUF6966 domain-containing protein n=1 Tax=Gallaecimonas mangrovi TaxID=2291597 RepID=UPI000E1FCAB7|nr:hypothetical protein [Gallaecimonas mangrovi]
MSLNSDIAALNLLLKTHGEKHWRLPTAHSSASAAKVLRMFGGMGSIGDLVLCQSNGHRIDKHEERAVNSRFRALLSSIYRQCSLYDKTP